MVVWRYLSEKNGAQSVTCTGETMKPMYCAECWDFAVEKHTMAVTWTLERVQFGMLIFSVLVQSRHSISVPFLAGR